MSVVNVTPEAHAAAKQAAEREGRSLSMWASDALTMRASYKPEDVLSTPLSLPPEMWTDSPERTGPVMLDVCVSPRLLAMALERSESPSETLSAALDALARPTGESVPRADVDACIERWKAVVAKCVEAAGAPPCHEADAAEAIASSFAVANMGRIQPPKPRPTQECSCDGPTEPGPWHKPSCGRRT